MKRFTHIWSFISYPCNTVTGKVRSIDNRGGRHIGVADNGIG